MAILQFSAGPEFTKKALAFNPGTVYFDTSTGEVWFDDPQALTANHTKVIDLDTLIYDKEEFVTVDFLTGPTTSKNTAKLGSCVLGTMILGQT